MTLYAITITNHSGFPFYNWENPNIPKHIVNVVKYTRYPFSKLDEIKRDFHLECGYTAAMSLAAKTTGTEVTSIRKRPVTTDKLKEEHHDIIFDITVDTYMNEQNLTDRIARAVDLIIFTPKRPLLETDFLTEEEETKLRNVFNDVDLRTIINKNMGDIGKAIVNTLERIKGEEQKLYEYGILGVGVLSSSYNIIFYKGLKTLLGLSDDEIEYGEDLPDNESELDNVLSSTQMPINIDGGESKFAYPFERNFNFIIHNFDFGPKILDVKEPFHLIIGVKAGFPSKQTIDDIVRAITPYLLD